MMNESTLKSDEGFKGDEEGEEESDDKDKILGESSSDT
jgi:hypothetical protein